MIVKLKRPEDDDGHAPWVVYDQEELLDFIDPTPELRAMMETESGYFEAEPQIDGWTLKRRVADRHW